jgi:hypothetical protein
MVIAMNNSLFVLMIMATIVATGTIMLGLTSHLLNPVMAQDNITKGNTTAGNMTGEENLTSTNSVGSNVCYVICD